MKPKISQKSEVHPNVKIGESVVIEAYSVIDDNVEIGDNTWIGSNVRIFGGARIGKGCRIFPGAVISAIPQDLKFKGEESVVEIGSNTTIRECVTINRGTATKGRTIIGSNCQIMAYAHVAHDVTIGDNCVLTNSVQIAGEVEIGNWVVIGGGTMVHQFCKIGMHAFISGMTPVISDIPPYIKAIGIGKPAKYQGINYVGLKRRGFEKSAIDNIHEIYRILYQENMNVSQALDYIEDKFEKSDEKQEIISFIKRSERGVIKGLNPE
jgi:UDP-N-acetylglucosamine acyltransferase